mgnify:FL=1
MLVNVIIVGADNESYQLDASNLKDVLSLIKLQKGSEYIKMLMDEDYKFILSNSSNFEQSIALSPEVIFSDFEGYDTLFLLKDISGNDPVSVGSILLAAFTAVSGVAVTGIPVWVVGVLGSIAIAGMMMGLNMLMSALSPTPEFSKDPAAQQNISNLFNGAPIIRNQGGSVPLIFGNPYAGAVLISSGAFSEEVSV